MAENNHVAKIQHLERLRMAMEIFNHQDAAHALLTRLQAKLEASLREREAELQAAVAAAPLVIPTQLQTDVAQLRTDIGTIRSYEQTLVRVAFETVRRTYNDGCVVANEQL
jgi:hypothetical protein